MSTRAMGPGAGLRWLKSAINLGRHNPKAIFGAVALVALVALIPSVVQLAAQYGAGVAPQTVLMIAGLTTLVMIFIYPLLIGGMLRVIHASETGQPTRATAVFDTFKRGGDAGQLIGFGVLLTVIYIAIFVLVVFAIGQEFMSWYMQMLTASMQTGAPSQMPAIPQLPDGFGALMAIGMVVGLFTGGVYAIGFGQVALGGRGIGGALADGVAGTAKNLLPIIVLAVIAFLVMMVLMIVIGLVAALLMLAGSLVHESMALVLLAPVYLGMLVVIYVVMFGVMYYMWRDICGEASPPVVNDNQVEA